MKRYFYPADRLHHAACMAIDFGMQFESKCGDPLYVAGGKFAWGGGGGYAGPAYIHSDSPPLLEPKVGDVVRHRMTDCWYTGEPPIGVAVLTHHQHDMTKEWSFYPKFEDIDQILERDGKPFHWPEVEE